MTSPSVARTVTAAAVAATAALAGTVAVAAPAQGARAKLSLFTHEKPLDIPPPADEQFEPFFGHNQGWWSAWVGHDGDGYPNPNYATGYSEYHGPTRSFFTFQMEQVERPIAGATLRLQRGCATSADATEQVQLYDVTTDAAALNRGTAPIEETYQDLGSGQQYGRASLSTADGQSEYMRVRLNAKAVAALNRARGRDGYWSVGATVTTANEDRGDQQVWGCTQEAAELILTLR